MIAHDYVNEYITALVTGLQSQKRDKAKQRARLPKGRYDQSDGEA